MKCPEIKSCLSEYLDGELEPSVRREVDRHLEDCSRCRAELESLRDMVKTLSGLDKVKAPPDFLNRFHDRLQKQSLAAKILNAVFIPFKIKIPLEFATAAALGVIIFFIVQPIRHQQISQQNDRQTIVSGKKQTGHRDEGMTAKPAPQPPAKAPAQESESVKRKAERSTAIKSDAQKVTEKEAPASNIASSPAPAEEETAVGGQRAAEPQLYKTAQSAPATTIPSETKQGEEKLTPEPVIISLLVPAGRETPGSGDGLAQSQPYTTADSIDEAEKKKSPAVSGAVSPMPEKPEQDMAAKSAPAPPSSAATIEEKISGLVDAIQGKVISIERDDLGHPTLIHIEIPAADYMKFIGQIGSFAQFQSRPQSIRPSENQRIPLTIRLIPHP